MARAATKDHNAEQTDGGKDPGTPENEAAKEKLDEAREGANGEGVDEKEPATPAEAAAQDKKFDEAPAEPGTTVPDHAGVGALAAIGETSGVKEEKDDDGNTRVVADPEAKVVNGE